MDSSRLLAEVHDAAHIFVALYTLAGFAVGAAGVVPSIMVKAFLPAVPFCGLSFSYNIAYAIFGALTPPFVGLLLRHFGSLAPARYVAFTAMTGMAVSIYLMATQRRGATPQS